MPTSLSAPRCWANSYTAQWAFPSFAVSLCAVCLFSCVILYTKSISVFSPVFFFSVYRACFVLGPWASRFILAHGYPSPPTHLLISLARIYSFQPRVFTTAGPTAVVALTAGPRPFLPAVLQALVRVRATFYYCWALSLRFTSGHLLYNDILRRLMRPALPLARQRRPFSASSTHVAVRVRFFACPSSLELVYRSGWCAAQRARLGYFSRACSLAPVYQPYLLRSTPTGRRSHYSLASARTLPPPCGICL